LPAFSDSGQNLINDQSNRSFALADVDGDGDLDMVEGNNSANRVWINGGDSSGSNTGIFTDSGQALGNATTSSIALGDVDGDGDLDIVTGNSDANRVWINGADGSGSNTGVFTDSGQALGNDFSPSIALGDVDDDGDLDIVAGNRRANRVWINGGDSSGSNTGIFSDSGQALDSEATLLIALGDVDGDGDLDIVAANIGANRVWINGSDSSGNNTGIFTDSGQALGTKFTQSIVLGDIDGDGDLDIVTGNRDANRVWINGGDNSGSNTGVFTDSGQALGSESTGSIDLGDVDDDGDLDIVAGNRVWINGGDSNGSNTGIFTDSGQALGNRATSSIALGDVNGDGDLDIMVNNSVWLNSLKYPSMVFIVDSGQALGSGRTQSIALGDIDGDGDLDIVTGNGINENSNSTEADRVWINGGDSSGSNTGIFTDSGQALGNESTRSITLGDIDGDGDLDIVVGNFGPNIVWINGGDSSGSNTGIFTDSGQTLGNENTLSTALGDIDDDGDLDIIEGNNGANRVWINGGSNTGIFTDSGQALGSEITRSIALGDIDDDGDLDIVTGNNNNSRVWINGGSSNNSNTGIFTDSGQTLGSGATRSIVLGDIDGDGDLDIATGNAGNNRIWINGGDNNNSNAGVFIDSGQALGIEFTRSIILGDIDGDGDLDIVTENSNGANRVWINGGNSNGSNTGRFADSGQTLGNAFTESITLGDIDGDSDLDIIIGNDGANQVWLNDF